MKNKNITFSENPTSNSRYILIRRTISLRHGLFSCRGKSLDFSAFFDTSFDEYCTSDFGIEYSVLCPVSIKHPKSLTAFTSNSPLVKTYSLPSARALRSKFIRDFHSSLDCFAIVDYDVFLSFYETSAFD
ncbi:hypothetical protein [Dipodfec virus UOA04_Rod_754]|nr:hypothetical protein [Dipodfec virus UOA04_Rod_754]